MTSAVNSPDAPPMPRSVMIVGPEPEGATRRGGHVADVAVLLDELAAADIDATVVTDSAGGDDLPFPARLVRSLGRAVRATREARKLRPDLVIILAGPPASFLEKNVLAGLCRVLGLRTVLCPRSGHMTRAIEEGSPLFRWALRLVARFPDSLAVQTEGWRRFYIERVHVPADRITVVENWVVTASLLAAARELVVGERIGIVHITRRRSDKGLDDVLAMVPIIAPTLRRHRAVLTIVGEGPGAERIQETVERYTPYVAWLPSMPRDAFLRFLASQDVLVAPSRAEGFPNLLVEAACLGVAIVASPVGGIIDVIRHGETGILVPPGAPDRLAAEVCVLIEDADRRREMARAAKAEALERFTASVNVRRLVRVGLDGA